MHLEKLTIVNFKNFQKLSLTLEPGVNLFVGTNGSGKTSLLEACNVAMGAFFGSREQKMQRPISYEEIRVEQGKRESEAKISGQGFGLGTWTRAMKTATKSNSSAETKPMAQWGSKVFNAFEMPEDRTIAPLIVYYSTQRLFNDANVSKKQDYDPTIGRAIGYQNCLKLSSINKTINEWLRVATTDRASKQIMGINYKDQCLELVSANIIHSINHLTGQNNSLSIYYSTKDEAIYMAFTSNQSVRELPLSYYSDGFRNIIYLIADLTWRASQLNPWLDAHELSDQTYGVVTLDEIDLHLHPKWQSKIISLLQTLFPKVQFLITTHSPTVVANFEGGHLFVIDGDMVERYEGNYMGKLISDVIKNVLGAPDRHVPTQRRLDELFELIDNDEQGKFEVLYKELVEQLGRSDYELIKARNLFDFKHMNLEVD